METVSDEKWISVEDVLRQLIFSSEAPNKEATSSLLNLIDEMSPGSRKTFPFL